MSFGLIERFLPDMLNPLAAGPMEQFEIVRIFPLSFNQAIDISFTNASLWMMIVVGTVALLSFVVYALVRRARRSSTDAARMSCDVELKDAYGGRNSACGTENPLPLPAPAMI